MHVILVLFFAARSAVYGEQKKAPLWRCGRYGESTISVNLRHGKGF